MRHRHRAGDGGGHEHGQGTGRPGNPACINIGMNLGWVAGPMGSEAARAVVSWEITAWRPGWRWG